MCRFITGESFAGVYIPVITSYILERNKELPEEDRINIEGMIIGNPGNLHWIQYLSRVHRKAPM